MAQRGKADEPRVVLAAVAYFLLLFRYETDKASAGLHAVSVYLACEE